MNLQNIQSIFIMCPNWVGDFAMATPVFRELRQKFPQAHITMALKPPFKQLIEGSPWCDEILLYDKKQYRGLSGLKRFSKQFSRKYDLAVILPNSIRSGIISFLTRAKIRIGYSRPGGFLMLTHSMKRPLEGTKFQILYTGEYYAELLSLLGTKASTLQLELPLDKETQHQAQEIWKNAITDESAAKVLFTPGAAFGSSKLWPETHVAKLIDLFAENNTANMLIAPGPGEEKIVENILALTKVKVQVHPPSPEGLKILKGLINEADLLICNDSGARHIAHSFRVPSVVMMGPTDPKHTHTPLERTTVLTHNISCAPCYLKKCPYSHHGCMTGIEPQKVYQTAIDTLEKTKGKI